MRDTIKIIDRELRLVSRHSTMGTVDSIQPERLERSAYLLLSRLEAEGPMSIGQLAEAFSLDTSTVNRQTAALVREGLVERIPDPDGGMARKLSPSDEGLRRLVANRDWSVERLHDVLSGWEPGDMDALAGLLMRFNHSVEARAGHPWPRDGFHSQSPASP